MNFVMRFCYQVIIVLGFCLTVTVIALSYGKFGRFFKNASGYLLMPSQDQNTATNLDKTPLKLSDLKFYTSYHVKGFLRLIASDLNEPIEVWYNKKHNKSRIDYYGGDVKTFQDGRLGLLVKIVPKYDSIKKTHTIGCWKKHSRSGAKIIAQSILPTKWSWPFKGSLDKFQHIGDERIGGKFCSKWRYEHKMMGRSNVYTYWVEKLHPPRPVRYEMVGYDTLLTSYYDKYIIDYDNYTKWEYDQEVFDIPQIPHDPGCWNASDAEHDEEGEHFMNPIGEFTSPHDAVDPVEEKFHRYRKTHGKKYDDQKEHLRRKHIFRHNTRFINSMNRRNHSFKLKSNSFTDMTEAEYNRRKGGLPDHPVDLQREKRKTTFYINEKYKPHKRSPKIPERLDWRKYGAVSDPRGQGNCGCCWAFAAIGAIESANFIKTGKMVKLSEQQMVDCTWKVKGAWKNKGNRGCHGGMAWKVFFWGKSHTIATSGSYGPYKGQEGYCKTKNITEGAKIYGFRRVKKHSARSLRRAVAYHGPAAVAINSHPLTLKFYSHGVLDDKSCSNATDHAVLVVGYGQENGVNYWLVKNSWSTMWGDKGYVKIREDRCGVLNKPVVVLNKHIKFYPWSKNSKWRNDFRKNSIKKWHKKHRTKKAKRKIKQPLRI